MRKDYGMNSFDLELQAETEKENFYYENGFNKYFCHRQVFYKFEKEEFSSLAYVFNDLNPVGCFVSQATNKKEFISECEYFMMTTKKMGGVQNDN